MKTHNINDAQLQAAIDEACHEVAKGPHRPICAELSLRADENQMEAPARLALAKAFLARLPEPSLANELQRLACEKGNEEAIKEVQQYAAMLSNKGVRELIMSLEKCLPEPTPTNGAAVTQNGTIYYNPVTAYRHAEEYECAMKHLDNLGVATKDKGKTLSLVGRISKAIQGAMDVALLPEPTPPALDGKTPGQVCYEIMNPHAIPYDVKLVGKFWEECASAVLAAFGGASLEAAIARMEAVPCEELEKAYWNGQGAVGSVTACERIRARLIAAARGQVEAVSQPAEIPWIEWHGGECPLNDEEVEEWEYKFRNGISKKANNTPSMYAWYHTPHDDHDDIVAYRVLKWREANQPAEQADPYADLKAAHAEGKIIQWRFKGATAWMTKTSNFDQYPDQCEYRIKPEPATFEAHGHTWTKASHRPQNATAPVYWLLESELSGARPYAPDFISTSENLGDWEGIVGWRYADKPEPAPTWQPTVGDVVTLKSGSPKMTVNLIITDKSQCVWFVGDEAKYITVSPATLQPA